MEKDTHTPHQLSGRELLLNVLQNMEISIIRENGNCIWTDGGFSIEIEGPYLYKLLHEDDVIAPYQDVMDMCVFIKTYA